MGTLLTLVCWLLTLVGWFLYLYMLAILARVLLSWFPFNPNRRLMAVVAGFLYVVTDPVLSRVGRLIPPVRLGRSALDFSPVVAIFGIGILRELLFVNILQRLLC